jgi:hypothetical protein
VQYALDAATSKSSLFLDGAGMILRRFFYTPEFGEMDGASAVSLVILPSRGTHRAKKIARAAHGTQYYSPL